MNQNLPEDPQLREMVKLALQHKVTRRAAIGGTMAASAAALLAACAPSGTKTLTPAKDVSDTDPTVIWSNWSLYIDVDDEGNYPTLETFQKQTGIAVTYREDFDDNDSYFGKVKDQLALGQDIGADITCPTSWMAARWINLGYCQTFDDAELPNKKNLQPAYLGVSYDPQRTMSLPYQGILAGFAYDKKAYKAATGKDAPAVLEHFWNPALKGRIGVLSEMRDTVGIVLMDQGIKIGEASSLTEDAFMAAIDVIAAKVSDGQIARIKGNSYKDDLVNGDTIAAIAWSGDIIQLNAEAGYERFGFVLPESGGTISADCFVIPMGATHKKNAEKLMNFYYDPYNAAVLAAYVNYITPVVGAKEEAIKLDPALAENQLIFPSEEFLAQTQAFRSLDSKEEQAFTKAFAKIKLGVRNLAKEFVARGADLELKSIRKEFPGFTAIENLDLKVPAGEFFALLGPSGCGKTTTLRLVAGLESPTKGKILIGKKDVTETKPHERPVNTVFQSYALFPHMTVLENVAFGLKQRKIDDPLKKAKEALNLVQLAHLAERKPQQLSGGQQQRVALARALVNRPSLLLLDEPLGALDLKLRREMQIELKAIQIEVGLTFLHVTHDQEEAMDMADTVAVMNHGRIEQMGAPEALYDRPKTVFVSKFLGQSNLLVGDVTSSSANSISIEVAGNKISVSKSRAEKTSGKIAIGFRPEKAVFHTKKPAASNDKNVIGPGEIIDIRFTGVSNQYLIDIPDLGEITVFAQNMGQSPVIELGEKVWVSWSVDHSFGLADLPNGVVEE